MSTMKEPDHQQNGRSKPERSRREFLTQSSGLLLGATLGTGPALGKSRTRVPMTARSAGRIIGANDRIRVGSIGTGGMGTSHLHDLMGRSRPQSDSDQLELPLSQLANVEVTAVCDVYTPRLERAKELTGAQGYLDYRQLLSSGNCDCVIIATPEHWHYQMAIDTVDAGLDVYLQKPMTRSYEQARRLRDRVKKSDRVFQLGSQYCQSPSWWKARELYQQGHLGKIVLSQTSYHRNSRLGEWNYDIEDAQPGVNLDWKRWLGPLGKMEYSPEYFFRWRKYERFSGGIITDLLPHKIHSLLYVLGANQLPRQVTCVGGIYVHPDRTVADTVVMTIDYGDSVILVSGSTCNERGLEDLIRGHQATLYVGENAVRVAPERPFVDEMDPLDIQVEPAPMSGNRYHLNEFFESMRSRKQPTWNVESAYKVMTAIAMAETAYLEKRTVHFDAKRERVL